MLIVCGAVARAALDREQPCEPPAHAHHLNPIADVEKGRITSFFGATLERYTSYRGHTPAEGNVGAVKQLLFTDKGVLSVSKHSVHYATRRGLTQWHLTYVGACCSNRAVANKRRQEPRLHRAPLHELHLKGHEGDPGGRMSGQHVQGRCGQGNYRRHGKAAIPVCCASC